MKALLSSPSVRQFAVAASVVLTLCVAFPRSARADNLDVELGNQAPKIMQYLRDNKCENVGVVKFRVKKGKDDLTFQAGPLNANMSIRLENILILANDEKKPIGILHDVDGAATARKLPSYTNPTGRKRLFEEKFPLNWGTESFRGDLFLTGTVVVSPDMRTAEVTIEALNGKNSTPDKVVTFKVPVDRSLLSDLGQSWEIKSRSLKGKRDLDLVADDDAADKDKTKVPPTQSDEKLIDFEVRYNDQPQGTEPDPKNAGELRVREPKESDTITFVIKNVCNERVGVVLMVNGKNSLFQQEDDPDKCSRYILDPNDRYVIEGFKMDKNKVTPFKVLSDAESEALAYTDNLGLITVHVFRTGEKTIEDPKNDPPPTGEGMHISRKASLRATTRGKRSALPATYKERLTQVKLNTGTIGKRGVIDIDTGAQDKDDETKDAQLPNPQHVMAIAIRYWKPKGSE